MTIVELENNRYDFLCCGFAAGIRNHHDQTQVDIETKKKINQILTTKVNDVICYCPGCWMSVSRFAPENNLKVHYVINRILRAFGDEAPAGKK